MKINKYIENKTRKYYKLNGKYLEVIENFLRFKSKEDLFYLNENGDTLLKSRKRLVGDLENDIFIPQCLHERDQDPYHDDKIDEIDEVDEEDEWSWDSETGKLIGRVSVWCDESIYGMTL